MQLGVLEKVPPAAAKLDLEFLPQPGGSPSLDPARELTACISVHDSPPGLIPLP